MQSTIVVHAWTVISFNNNNYLPYTHWVYLNEIVKYYSKVYLLSPVYIEKNKEKLNGVQLEFDNVSVIKLPYSGSYLNSILCFKSYYRAYKNLSDINVFYSRYPVPFGWLQKLFGKDKKRILHYVGDPIDAANNNPNFSLSKKLILTTGFKLENKLFDWACKDAIVYTNGHHIADRLRKKNIKATPLVSSTLRESDFFTKVNLYHNASALKFVYLGNLRTAKGVETILRAFKSFNVLYPLSTFTIIGSGEFEKQLKKIVLEEAINNVDFVGRLDDREMINSHLRASDVFLFGSLSEGSPRVILEAMANSLVVVSTPVGSLPDMFKHEESILYANFNDSNSFLQEMLKLVSDEKLFNRIKNNSHNIAKQHTIENFLKKIFYVE